MKKNNQADIRKEDSAAAEQTVITTRKKKRKKAPIIIAIVIILLIVFRLVSGALNPDTGAAVTTTTALRGDLNETISTSGTVVSGEKKLYFASVGGTLAEVAVAAGDAVEEGDLLISYDMEQVEKQLREAELQRIKSEAGYNGIMADNSENVGKLGEANTNLNVLEQQITDYKAYIQALQEKKDQNLRDTGNNLTKQSSDLQREQAELQGRLAGLAEDDPQYAQIQQSLQEISVRQSEVTYQQSTYSNSEYIADLDKEIAKYQEELSKCEEYKAKMESQKSSSEGAVLSGYDQQSYSADKELAALSYQQAEADYQAAQEGIRASFDGIVTECSVVTGAMIAEGTQLLTLESSSDVLISFQASKNDVEKLELGQNAEITIAGNSYTGEISKIDRMATTNQSNTPMVGVSIKITNPDEKIILGMDAKMTILTHTSENALLVPVEVINADKEGDFLYVVENGVVVRKSVVCGISSDLYTEILEGITEEDQIVLTSYTSLEEGMAVTAVPQQ